MKPFDKLRVGPAWVNGFTLVEVMLGSAILGVLVVALALILNMAATSLGRARVMQTAQSLLSERIELARNMPYVDLGTPGGIPEGELAATEAVVVNGQTYHLTTTVVYVDDPFDGTEALETDSTPTDYKRVRVTAEWEGVFASQKPLVMWSDVVSKSVETEEGGGTIKIQVFNALGVGVGGATVSLEAPTATPSVDLDIVTDEAGRVELPGAPACDMCYAVRVTKSGYTSDQTYNLTQVDNPIKPPLTVLEGEVTEASFAIDVPSTLTIRAVRQNYVGFAGVQLTLRGNKLIGRTSGDEPVYKYQQNVVTGFGGQTTVNNLEWDEYQVFPPSGSSVDKAGSMPFTPFSVEPGSNQAFTLGTAPATDQTLLVRIRDQVLGPIASASVTLRNDLVSVLATQSTALAGLPDSGQTFFDGLPTTLSPYQLLIESVGFEVVATEATVSGDIVEDYILAPL